MDYGNLILAASLLAVILALAAAAVRIVPEYERLIVFRLGRLLGEKGPGLVLLIPVVDRGVRADLRETFFDVPPQTCITKDNAQVSIDFLVYMRIVEAVPSVIAVEHYGGAARGIAITTLRAVVGDMLLDEVLSKRDNINEALRLKLDDVTNRWGIKVTAVEIREIIPPREIQDAMSKQMAAERKRRATVTEAEGAKRAAILDAEGTREADILRAEGRALALHKLHEVARGVDDKTLSLQYLDTLVKVGNGKGSTVVLPMELTSFLQSLARRNGAAAEQRSGRHG